MKSAIFISIIVLTAGYSPAWSGESPKTSTAAVVYSHRTLWTLQETTRIALRQNPDLLTALDNIQAAEDVIGQSVSGYLPHIEGAAGVQRSTLPQPSAGSTALLGQPSPYASAALAVQQTVFDFGQALEHIRSEVSRERAAKEELYAFQNVVTLGVEKAFYDVALTKDLVAVAKRAEAEFRETQRDTTLLVDTGVRPPFDLSQANVELETAKLSLIKAQNSHDLAKVALLNIMGMHDRVDFEIEASTQIPGISTKKMDLDWIIGQGLQLRPEMRRDTLEVKAAKQALRSEVASLLPSASVNGWYGGFGPDYPESLSKAWGVGVGVSWDIFDGLFTPYKIGELSAQLKATKAQREKERLAIIEQISNAYLNLARAEQELTVAQEALIFAKENLDLGQKRYRAGVGTILELLIAEASEVNAEASNIQAIYGQQIAMASLATAVNAPLESLMTTR
ncbi:MAG: TolC family protein [Elusimicrobiota bacterium]